MREYKFKAKSIKWQHSYMTWDDASFVLGNATCAEYFILYISHFTWHKSLCMKAAEIRWNWVIIVIYILNQKSFSIIFNVQNVCYHNIEKVIRVLIFFWYKQLMKSFFFITLFLYTIFEHGFFNTIIFILSYFLNVCLFRSSSLIRCG